MSELCTTQDAYTGIEGLCDPNSNYGTPVKVLFTKNAFTVTDTTFLLAATFTTGIKAKEVIPLKIHSLNWEDKEEQMHEFETGEEMLSRRRVYVANIGVNAAQCLKQEIIKLNNFVGGMMIVYDTGYIQACSHTAGSVIGMRINKCIVKDEIQKSTGNTDPRMLNIRVVFTTYKDFNENEYSRQMTWETDDLDGLSEATLVEVGTSSDTTIVFDAYVDCGGRYTPISGLAKDDLAFTGGTITSLTESTTTAGRYTIAGTGLTTGTLDVVAPSASTYTELYLVSAGGVSITIAGGE